MAARSDDESHVRCDGCCLPRLGRQIDWPPPTHGMHDLGYSRPSYSSIASSSNFPSVNLIAGNRKGGRSIEENLCRVGYCRAHRPAGPLPCSIPCRPSDFQCRRLFLLAVLRWSCLLVGTHMHETCECLNVL